MSEMEKRRIIPNHYISFPYMNACDLCCFDNDYWIWVENETEEGTLCVFPPLRKSPTELPPISPEWDQHPIHQLDLPLVWSDFPNYPVFELQEAELLDYEFYYVPGHFLDLEGKEWKKFRKNVNKWKDEPDLIYRTEMDYMNVIYSASELIEKWIEQQGEGLHDPSLIRKLSRPRPGDILSRTDRGHTYGIREYLFQGSELIGINVFDYNYQNINYRFCITDPDRRFLDEYMRYMFYIHRYAEWGNIPVNDGGCLGREGLHWFKNTLNPAVIRPVHVWTE